MRSFARCRPAFTLVEITIAIVILGVGILALAGSASAIIRQMRLGTNQALAAAVAQSRFEWLRTQPCAQLRDSATSTRGVDERWSITPGANSTAQATLTLTIQLRRTTERYVTVVLC